MANESRPQVIAIEEHYLDEDVDAKVNKQAGGGEDTRRRLLDLGELRLREMDEAGIDIQVLSHCPPGAQAFDKDEAQERAQGVNNRLFEVVQARPDRFAAFGSLPTRNPDACPDELERCVKQLGFKGAMIHGLTDGKFHDLPEFWPIFAKAEELDVPIYIHPGRPHPAVIEAYYKEYAEKYRSILSAGWGFTVETATQGIRNVLRGVLDKYPNVKIILGHLGESLPFSLWRINSALSRDGNRPSAFRDTFCEHFHITTSGNFSDPALLCCIQEMGVDRILFAIDYPFVENGPGPKWMENLMLNADDKAKILHGNAERLLGMKRGLHPKS